MIEFLTANWGNIVGVIAAILVAADKIVKLTPSTVDDQFVAKVESALNVIGIKQTAGLSTTAAVAVVADTTKLN